MNTRLTAPTCSGQRTPRVFIGLPVYNGAQFLERTINSLLGQSYADFTLLISDNASNDETQAICMRYCARDPRVRYVRQSKNIGAPANWNYVADQAEGDYFKWSTANDECAPQMIESCVLALDADASAVLCQGRTCLVDEETDEREEYSKDLALLDSRPSVRLKDLICNLRLNNGQCGLIRLNSLRRTGLDRPYRGGDITLMAELAILGKFLVLPEVLLFRRMGPTTFSRFLKKEGYKAFYGERANQALASHRLHRHFEILCAAMFYPIEWREKLASTKVAISQVFWDLASYRRHRSQPTSLS